MYQFTSGKIYTHPLTGKQTQSRNNWSFEACQKAALNRIQGFYDSQNTQADAFFVDKDKVRDAFLNKLNTIVGPLHNNNRTEHLMQLEQMIESKVSELKQAVPQSNNFFALNNPVLSPTTIKKVVDTTNLIIDYSKKVFSDKEIEKNCPLHFIVNQNGNILYEKNNEYESLSPAGVVSCAEKLLQMVQNKLLNHCRTFRQRKSALLYLADIPFENQNFNRSTQAINSVGKFYDDVSDLSDNQVQEKINEMGDVIASKDVTINSLQEEIATQNDKNEQEIKNLNKELNKKQIDINNLSERLNEADVALQNQDDLLKQKKELENKSNEQQTAITELEDKDEENNEKIEKMSEAINKNNQDASNSKLIKGSAIAFGALSAGTAATLAAGELLNVHSPKNNFFNKINDLERRKLAITITAIMTIVFALLSVVLTAFVKRKEKIEIGNKEINNDQPETSINTENKGQTSSQGK